MLVRAALMSDTLHALGWLLVMDYTRVVALWWCRRVGADGNNVRPASLWKGRRSGHMGATYPDGQHCPIKWIMEQKRSSFYGISERFIFCASFEQFSRELALVQEEALPAIITPWNQKLFPREIWQQLFSSSRNYFRRLCSIQKETQ